MTEENQVYEPSKTTTVYNPYDAKVGGKPPATLADGTVPTLVKQVASRADGPAYTAPEAELDVPTADNKVDEIKAYLDAKGIAYDGVTKKADLLDLLPAE